MKGKVQQFEPVFYFISTVEKQQTREDTQLNFLDSQIDTDQPVT